MVEKLVPTLTNQDSRLARASTRTSWPPKPVCPAEALHAAHESPLLLHRPAVYVGSCLFKYKNVCMNPQSTLTRALAAFAACQCHAICLSTHSALCDKGVFKVIHSTGFRHRAGPPKLCRQKVWGVSTAAVLGQEITSCPRNGIVAEVRKFAHKDLNEQYKSDMVREIESIIVFVDQRVIAGVVSGIVEYHESL
ncbi:hypothetical protein C8R45DRAFT_936991 [Mycena sanguinolenta]|nr:hypothetical protein C8R45DRAFT_936991 [Mycena sanguinolenta]